MRTSTLTSLGLVCILLFLVAITILQIAFSVRMKNEVYWVLNSEKVLRNSSQLMKIISERESGLRGFVASGNEDFLNGYNELKTLYTDIFKVEEDLVKNNSAQSKLLHDINRNVQDWDNTFSDVLIEAKMGEDYTENGKQHWDTLFNNVFLKEGGRRKMDQIKDLFREFEFVENNKRNVQETSLSNAMFLANSVSYVLSAVSIIIGMVIFFYIRYRRLNDIL